MLILTRRKGEAIHIGDDIKIVISAVKNGVVRVGIEAPPDVAVHRHEIYRLIQDGIPKDAKT